jgi:hypothetical protein
VGIEPSKKLQSAFHDVGLPSAPHVILLRINERASCRATAHLCPRESGLNNFHTRHYGGGVWKSNPCGVLILCNLLILLEDQTTKTDEKDSLGYNLATISASLPCPLLPPVRLLRRADPSPGRSTHSSSFLSSSTQCCDRSSNPLSSFFARCAYSFLSARRMFRKLCVAVSNISSRVKTHERSWS